MKLRWIPVFLVFCTSAAWAGRVDPAVAHLTKNIPMSEATRRFYVKLLSSKDLVDFVNGTKLSTTLKRETLTALEDKHINVRRPFPRCRRTDKFEIKCGQEVLLFTEHGFVLNGVGIKFDPETSYLENLDQKLDDLAESTKPLKPRRGRGLASAPVIPETLENPIAAAAVVIHEAAFLSDFIYGKNSK